MKDFRRLDVWRKAHELALAVYAATRAFPRAEQYGLTSQVRRSAVSIAANIAEGCGCGSDADFARFLQIAMGSASETEYYFVLAHDMDLLADGDHQRLMSGVVEAKRMLASFIARLRRPSVPGSPPKLTAES